MEQVFVHIRGDPSVKRPERIHAPPEKRSCNKYRRFHRDHGHDPNNYFYLKEQIEALIQRCRLQRFIVGPQRIRRENARRDPPTQEERRPEGPIGEIRVISGGFAGESISTRKSYMRQIHVERDLQLMTTEKPAKQLKLEYLPITFLVEDDQGVS